jgi:hypothetical protein
MERYRNLSSESGVTAYAIGEDYIIVEFEGGKRYKYSYRSASADAIEKMKQLAVRGTGLNGYINSYVKHLYE